MAYHILEVKHRAYPSSEVVTTVLSGVGLTLENVLAAFGGYICPLPLTPGEGYQMPLAKHLEGHLEGFLRRDGLRPSTSRYDLTYSHNLNQHADFGLVHEASKKRVLF